ncbi:c-type cytochrome [Roseateles cellulosilyticus]|uniref:Cytochrome c n=1 Tax=Pelomonas cellulosilytica TaxID=2906762 RepID=A0ABS8XMA0_9BURK|nr:cytochrome c [Pelomonas sp. P8]MCE4553907.1 cytochrome c [Pelomonas sp. P8]
MTPDPQITPQQQRENPDPLEGSNPVPNFVRAGIVLALLFGIAYITTADIETPADWGDGRQAGELAGVKPKGGAKVDGAALFSSLCAACHQATGQGLPGVFPPLAGSEWVQGRDSTTAAILLHGISGPLTVRGNTYNGAMPAFGGQLSDEQIAAVLTHVRSQWGNTAAPVTPETVAEARAATAQRTAPFGGDKELPPHD